MCDASIPSRDAFKTIIRVIELETQYFIVSAKEMAWRRQKQTPPLLSATNTSSNKSLGCHSDFYKDIKTQISKRINTRRCARTQISVKTVWGNEQTR